MPARLLLLAPLIFLAHVAEESPGFVAWFNAHVTRDITPGLFRTVNLTALVITGAVIAVEFLVRSELSAAALVAWLSFLMPANALVHIAGAVSDRAYVPGLVTAVALYLPYYAWVVGALWRERRVSRPLLALASMLGAMPMLIHGYRVVLLGSRLF